MDGAGPPRTRKWRFNRGFRNQSDGRGRNWRISVIIAHNHPSGVAEPSQADRAITERIRDAMALIDVRLMDHFVVGDGEVVSFAERGWI